MHEMELYKLRPVMGDQSGKDHSAELLPVSKLHIKKRRAKARTCLRIVGGLSWIAGLLIIVVTAAGIEQDMSGWQLVGMAAVGLGLLGVTAVVSRMEERRLRNDKR